MNKLARHHGRRAGKPIQVDEITIEVLSAFLRDSVRVGLVWGFGLGRGLVRDSVRERVGPGFGPRRVGLGRLSVVRTILSYGILRDCVRGNNVLVKIG